MNVLFDHVDWKSTAGPYWFAQKLAASLNEKGHTVNADGSPDIQLTFVEAARMIEGVPLVQRLDGIWYNTKTEYKKMNEPIKQTYDIADGVVFQSKFDRDFIIHHFGDHKNYTIIHNGADQKMIEGMPSAEGLDAYDTVWSCASSWINVDGSLRHNKRLNENIRYFQEHSGDRDILCIAGNVGDTENPDSSKIMFLGELSVYNLISLYKRSDWFIHLATQDHCPNVVVDAKVAGCKIVCASSGGTHEIAGKEAIIVVDENEHGFDAYDYNVPTTLDFSKYFEGMYNDVDLSIDFVADEYLKFFNGVIK